MDAVKSEKSKATREKIFNAAIELFSKFGYAKVTMRDIASAVGVKAASIYYYFPSKRDLLNHIYQYSVEQHRKAQPDLDELLRRAETDALQELQRIMTFGLAPSEQAMHDTILLIAMHEITYDADSARFIEDVLFYPIEHFLTPVLQRMQNLGRIELTDIPAFISIVKNHCLSTAMLNATPLKSEHEMRDRGFSLLFSLIHTR